MSTPGRPKGSHRSALHEGTPVTRMLLAFDDETALAQALAVALGCPLALVARHRFPDGETRLRLPPRLPAQLLLLRGLQDPNAKLTELLLTAAGARELGATQITLISPYLAYMRQDFEFTAGEVVSQRQLGRLLAHAFDAVVTVDPHLHRVATMDEVVPGRRGLALSAAPLLGAHVARQVPGALLLAPDEEAGQWVRAAAQAQGLDHAVCHKQRRGDHDVDVALPDTDVQGRAVVLLDDVASTGRTLVAAARGALARGAATVDVAVTHALFVDDALVQVRAAGVRHVWSSDSVPHATNAVSIVPLLAAALRDSA
jgi:ribose-phosphate pyrophosphokinase